MADSDKIAPRKEGESCPTTAIAASDGMTPDTAIGPGASAAKSTSGARTPSAEGSANRSDDPATAHATGSAPGPDNETPLLDRLRGVRSDVALIDTMTEAADEIERLHSLLDPRHEGVDHV
jgi:hypothetical protein